MKTPESVGKRSVSEMAGETWRRVLHELERAGVSLPNNFDAIGAAHGSYVIIGTALQERDAIVFEETIRRVEQILREKHPSLFRSCDCCGGSMKYHWNGDEVAAAIRSLTLPDQATSDV